MISLDLLRALGVTGDVITVFAILGLFISGLRFYKTIDERIDERINKRMKPSLELLQDTVKVVKNLEKNTSEMNATLSILKDLMLDRLKK